MGFGLGYVCESCESLCAFVVLIIDNGFLVGFTREWYNFQFQTSNLVGSGTSYFVALPTFYKNIKINQTNILKLNRKIKINQTKKFEIHILLKTINILLIP